MRILPTEMIRLLSAFVPQFSRHVWPHVQVLLIGAILAPGKRTVSSALDAMGLSQEERFHRYHRVLSRASWSSVKASRMLLGLLVGALPMRLRWCVKSCGLKSRLSAGHCGRP